MSFTNRAFLATKATLKVGATAAVGALAFACSEASSPPPPTGPQVAVLTGTISANRTLYADTVYTLSGYVKVASGATLTVQAGTKIVGDSTTPGSSLWILRGAKINANGTAAKPIVFTSAKADGFRKPGDWGGIIIVGNAPINRTGTSIFTEGPQGTFQDYSGGTDASDNSGTLRYVRIEFAGYDVSGGNGQELNSLSMYAVGRGTTIEYVEALAGLDDSFEWFGGTVDARYLVSYESGDDHFDWTEGYSGRNQFLIALQTKVITPAAGTGNVSSDPRGFEGDGCETNKAGCASYNMTPLSSPVFANFTVIGPGAGGYGSITDGNGAVIRRGSAGIFVNGIIARWPGYGVSVRNNETNQRITDGQLMMNNVTVAEITTAFEPINTTTASDTRWGVNLNPIGAGNTVLAATAGTTATLITSLTPTALDWTPKAGASIATSGLSTFPTAISSKVTGFFGGSVTATAYAGAAAPAGTKWWDGWTNYADK